MALFQTSVLNNYLKRQNAEAITKAYKKFAKYFLDTSIQQNIKIIKEEGFQEGFLRELFVNVLGYSINPVEPYNLTTEYKNETGAKKADGAILKNGNALGVIELKSTKTKDLESIRQQAFDYKANQTNCVYVVTSNFEKLRFYINNAVEFEEFDLFTPSQERFALLYLCLEKENLLQNIPLKIKEESIQVEEQITKKFYGDYSLFKRELYRDLVKLNMKNEVFRAEFNKEDTERANKNIKQNLFKKSQKLIDRFLFIFFAEDRDLLPPNSTLKILEQWNNLKDLDAYSPLYERFKLYFGYLDTGRKGTDKGAEIFAYNGGLFKPDTVLDSLQISDELLFKYTKALSNYDFESQVDVNILGHIFENSLNEIESVNAEIEGVEFDAQKTKRKKDGVYYTPKYITKYIVENTVGKLCTEKKAELGLDIETITLDFVTKDKKLSVKGLKYNEKIKAFRNWLLELKICDPACGSGAFLNQALDYLINEHDLLNEHVLKIEKIISGNKKQISAHVKDIANEVLENNIFGVDLNDESVEIAKLSLWLRTAQPRRKLNDLNNNIKCGNSLIDSKVVAGDKAFKWEEEFPQVFIKGGFDVVVGNPPWNSKISLTDSIEIAKKYNLDLKNLNMFAVFFYLGHQLVKESGLINLLVPEVVIKNSSYFELRNLIINKYNFISLTDFGQFPGVASNTVAVCYQMKSPKGITTVRKCKDGIDISRNINTEIYNENPIKAFSFDIENDKQSILNKISTNSKLGEIAKIKRGIELGQVTDLVECHNCNKYTEISTKYYSTRDSNKCKFCNSEINLAKKFSISSRIQNELYKVPCLSGKEVNRYTINDYYYIIPNLNSIDYKKDIFFEENLFVKRIATKPEATLLRNYSHAFNTLYSIYDLKINSKESLLLLLNSKLIHFYYELVFNLGMNLTTQVTVEYLKKIPIPKIENEQPFILKADIMISLNKEKQQMSDNFAQLLQSKFTIEKLTTKLQNWHELEFKAFLKELKKAKMQLSLSQEAEWMQYFNEQKQKAQTLKAEIEKTDKEIDKMVYQLYGLSEEEIKIVEQN